MRIGLVLAPCFLAGCNALLGISNVTPSDLHDATLAADGPPSADAHLGDVNGNATDQLVNSPTTTQSMPEDLTSETLQAYVPDGQGGFQIIDGKGRADGTFAIPNVPETGYYLLDIPQGRSLATFYYTTSRAPDLGTYRLGRTDGVAPTQLTTVSFDIAAMTPYHVPDKMVVYSLSAAESSGVMTPPLSDGATTAALPINWGHLPGATLLRAGDDLIVEHLQTITNIVNGVTTQITRPTDVYYDASHALSDGVPATITGNFATPATAQTLNFSMSPQSFIDGLDFPPDKGLSVVFGRFAGFSPETSRYDYGMIQVALTATAPPPSVFASWSFADPYPAAWLRFQSDSIAMAWTFQTRSTHLSLYYNAGVASEVVPASTTISLAPLLGVPHDILVNGAPTKSVTAIPFAGDHSVKIGWAPVVGVGKYVVDIERIDTVSNSARASGVASFTTSETSIEAPATLFTVGDSYFVWVTAIKTNADYKGGALKRPGFPRESRGAVTARLLFAASCGNGAVDASYEECDSSGVATVTCNADCTTSICGDGIMNTIAGEQCDLGTMNGVAGQCCDSTCLLASPATQCP